MRNFIQKPAVRFTALLLYGCLTFWPHMGAFVLAGWIIPTSPVAATPLVIIWALLGVTLLPIPARTYRRLSTCTIVGVALAAFVDATGADLADIGTLLLWVAYFAFIGFTTIGWHLVSADVWNLVNRPGEAKPQRGA